MAVTGIYCIHNVLNERSYVGSAVDVGARWCVHVRSLCANKHHSILLQRSWNKYGRGAFIFVVLEVVARADLYKREQYWIDNLLAATPEHGFNISPTAGGNLGRKLTAETRAKIARAGTGRRWKMSAEGRANLSAAKRGKPGHRSPKSAEHRAKLSAALTGRTHSPELVEKRRAGWKARFGGETPEYLFRAGAAAAAKRTPEKNKEILAKSNATRAAKRAAVAALLPPPPPPSKRSLLWTPEKREAFAKKRREWWATKTPEQRTENARKAHAVRVAALTSKPTVLVAATM